MVRAMFGSGKESLAAVGRGARTLVADAMYRLSERRMEHTEFQVRPRVNVRGLPLACVYSRGIWDNLPFRTRLRSIAAGRWSPDPLEVFRAGISVIQHDAVGYEGDGARLVLNSWQTTPELEGADSIGADRRAGALAMSASCARSVLSQEYQHLGLNLLDTWPELADLIVPTATAVPLRSLRWFVEPCPYEALGRMRSSTHEHAETLEDYFCDLIFLQHKLVVNIAHIDSTLRHAMALPDDTVFDWTLLSLAGLIEAMIVYEKSLAEKLVVYLCYLKGVPGVEKFKKQRQRLARLDAALDQEGLFYHRIVMDALSAEALERLNSYRNGILHKRGLASLRPDRLSDTTTRADLEGIAEFGREQFRKIAAALVATVAMTTDELVRRAPPENTAAQLLNGARRTFQPGLDLADWCVDLAVHEAGPHWDGPRTSIHQRRWRRVGELNLRRAAATATEP